MKRKIILGLTGSVATVLWEKLVNKLQLLGDVEVILTPKAEHFISNSSITLKVHNEAQEWIWYDRHGKYRDKWEKNDPILHIKLRERGSALVIAPCSANTLGKIASGICDNLLTSVARAWDLNRPLIISPAMNTYMWNHPITEENIKKLLLWGYHIIEPQEKKLACGTLGMGALANVDMIFEITKEALRWEFPINVEKSSGIPVPGYPGSFSYENKNTGIDLYCQDGEIVVSVEAGTVVGIENNCVLIEGATGVVCYSEITSYEKLNIGDQIMKGQPISRVKKLVKKEDKKKNNTGMLHIELYPHGITKKPNRFESYLGDPTPFLVEANLDIKTVI